LVGEQGRRRERDPAMRRGSGPFFSELMKGIFVFV